MTRLRVSLTLACYAVASECGRIFIALNAE